MIRSLEMRLRSQWLSWLANLTFIGGSTMVMALCPVFQQSQLLAQGGARENKVVPRDAVNPTRNRMVTHARVKTGRNRKRTRQNKDARISLRVLSNPPLSKVIINGELRGETDEKGELEVSLAHGIYSLRVSREGYITNEGDVEITPALGSQQEVELKLAPALLNLNIVTDPPGTEIYLNDVYKGTSNAEGLLVIDRLTAGQAHKLRVKKIGYAEQSNIPVTTYTGQISIKLLPDAITVKVNTDPPETEIYFDDVYKGATTADGGVLIVDQVNPNQTHKLRAKKSGYLEQVKLLSPNSAEASFRLLEDPVISLSKDIRQQITDGNLAKAFDRYGELAVKDPDNSELTRLLDSILQSLQARSSDTLKQIEPFGLVLQPATVEETKQLYDQARKWRPTDEPTETLGKYWDMKLATVKASQASSGAEKDALNRSARVVLSDLGQRNLRNMYLLLDFGWAWLKLGDPTAAQKSFTAAQELRPDWSYPYFASAVLAMDAGDREVNKKLKLIKYNQAVESFTKAISRKHDFARAYALRAIVYANMKNYPESTASGLQAIALAPNSAYAHFALGVAHFQKGSKAAYRSAKAEFERALSLDREELDQVTKNSITQRLAVIQRSIK
jgi:tetratricopeptide (TPR) repeat protein